MSIFVLRQNKVKSLSLRNTTVLCKSFDLKMTPNHKNKPQDEIRSTAKQCENFIKAAGAFEWKA